MGNLLRSLARSPSRTVARANETVTGLGVDAWSRMWRPGESFIYNGRPHQGWQLGGGSTNGGLYAGNSVVYACEQRRVSVFSEIRFQFQQLENGRAGNLFGNPALSVLEKPWPGATTRDLAVRCELDAATYGNSYWIRDPGPDAAGDYLVRLDPRFVGILTRAAVDPISGFPVGEQLIGYALVDEMDRQKITYFLPEDVAHYAPVPDPSRPFMGMSWMNPCLPDIDADQTMTRHKISSLNRGAQLGAIVSFPAEVTVDEILEFQEEFNRTHEGPTKAGSTLFLGGGADVKTVGQSFQDLSLKATQGAGETRIAACAGVPPVIVGLSEGLAGSSLNAGNYGAAKRNFVDGTMRPNWTAFAGAFESLVPAPAGSGVARLWYDDRDIPYLREDVTAQADILQKDALTIRQLLDAGYEPDAVIDAVAANDMKRLRGRHSGLFSVQLQDPTKTNSADPAAAPAATGN